MEAREVKGLRAGRTGGVYEKQAGECESFGGKGHSAVGKQSEKAGEGVRVEHG